MKTPFIPPPVRKVLAHLRFDNVTKKPTIRRQALMSEFQKIANAIENLLSVASESRLVKTRRAVDRWTAIVTAELQKEAAASAPRKVAGYG